MPTDAQKQATKRFKANRKEISIFFTPEQYAYFRQKKAEYKAKTGKNISHNDFIILVASCFNLNHIKE